MRTSFLAIVASSLSLVSALAPSLPSNPTMCYSFQCPLNDNNPIPNLLDITTTTYSGGVAICTYYNAQYMVDVATCIYDLSAGTLLQAVIGSECRPVATSAVIPCKKKRALEAQWKREAAEKKVADLEKRLTGETDRKSIESLKKRSERRELTL